jgi:hypothetical protein
MHDTDTFSIKDLFTPSRRPSLLGALAFLAAAYVVEHYANVYAFAYSAHPNFNHVGDLILDTVPVVNLNFLIIEGALIVIVLGALFVLSKPRYILFSLKSVALFIIVRAIFTSLTHIAIYPEHIVPGLGFFDAIYLYLNFQTGLFFSGHTGLPFLMGLIFWEHKKARRIFFLLSGIAGVSVLFAHVHYSIDVLAAPFMAYGIFNIAKRLFASDYALTVRG